MGPPRFELRSPAFRIIIPRAGRMDQATLQPLFVKFDYLVNDVDLT